MSYTKLVYRNAEDKVFRNENTDYRNYVECGVVGIESFETLEHLWNDAVSSNDNHFFNIRAKELEDKGLCDIEMRWYTGVARPYVYITPKNLVHRVWLDLASKTFMIVQDISQHVIYLSKFEQWEDVEQIICNIVQLCEEDSKKLVIEAELEILRQRAGKQDEDEDSMYNTCYVCKSEFNEQGQCHCDMSMDEEEEK